MVHVMLIELLHMHESQSFIDASEPPIPVRMAAMFSGIVYAVFGSCHLPSRTLHWNRKSTNSQ
ncbi:hypothetical protein SISNIDRAFT_422576 [Sistotremastrum niveocremeum HHB9708]|uniref:Uncharacterized protein n=1 Tax=Sistotremastrum niveocremeum HHB9708 TaxID=1314777 RepID=A0A165A8F6_9AGAM|nr:hypothetical protein SISNIDRAFT_422576 [Sistotremastrum niveocremeum HHB9708]